MSHAAKDTRIEDVARHGVGSIAWLGVLKRTSPDGCKRHFAAFVAHPDDDFLWRPYVYRRYLTELACRKGVRDLNKNCPTRLKFAGAELSSPNVKDEARAGNGAAPKGKTTL